ncbi:helix-turn-helix domain-containing protein [Roseibium aggregatum]|jgi:transcriptional regulator with XRE-family HTH domain|uniref:Transcriptional Regulator, XRE family protein n=1 Tax=Roseibium aggregatum (strain ATCC 25650 / DSM 13394 / JCM 20685 / NBRC 16684 / NCIMB 2208 / IAM 12614 / B1) TaxID=384765 RepID=A0NW43_ROSAI|nr:helix-turn-helix transcriptional regulator [Roseibium aggregatum]EAV43208.1 Transcriptional Regulator, XRE family protein [Stappia aggregata IAM 12614] [Roseibium aggregatum IAM 12614]
MADSKSKDNATGMTPQQFRHWRRALGLKQKDAADRLGLKKRMIQYYEKGNRDGRPVEIPKSIRLACYALSEGIADFDGQTTIALPAETAKPE